MENEETWADQQLKNLKRKTIDFTEKEKGRYDEAYLRSAIERIPSITTDEGELVHFKLRTEELIALFPTKDNKGRLKGNLYLKKLLVYKTEIQKKHRLVAKRYYLTIWFSMGIAMGLPFGVFFKELALGLPIGLLIGCSFGFYLDQKALSENRVI